MPLSRLTFTWQATQNAEAYRLFMDGQQIADVAEVGLELERDVSYGSHTFAIEAYNASGTGQRIQVVRSLDEPPPPVPGPVEGFDVSILAIVTQPPPSGGGGGSPTEHGYTVTHYVAPYASVAGATADTQNLGSTAYNAATDSGSPTTFRTALANASAGDVIELAPGSYVGAGGPGGSDAAFPTSVAGTSGNPIIFTAQYPAAYNTENYTQLKNTDSTPGGVADSPTLSINNYIVFDGFYFDYNDQGQASSRGVIYMGYAMTGTQIRRMKFNRANLGSADDGDNFNCIHFHGGTGEGVFDCVFQNGYDATGSHNEACITLYGAENVTIEHNTFTDVTIPIYVKGYDGGVGSYGTIRYNRATGCKFGIELTAASATQDMVITQNLFVGNPSSTVNQMIAFENSASSQCINFIVHHNTFIGNGSEDAGVVATESGVALTGCEFYDNIVVNLVDSTQVTVNAQQALTNMTTWDYNLYYENGNTPQYFYPSSTVTGIADWRTASSRDANSVEADPNFVNAASGDYTITSGTARTASSTGGPVGCYITNSEEIGIRANPTY